MQAHRQVVATLRRHRILEGLTHRCEILEAASRTGHQGTRLLDRLAIVQPLQLRQLFAARANAGRDAVQDGGAVMWFEAGPVRSVARRFGRLHRFIHIRRRGSVQGRHHAPVVRILGSVGRAGGIAPMPGNQCLDCFFSHGFLLVDATATMFSILLQYRAGKLGGKRPPGLHVNLHHHRSSHCAGLGQYRLRLSG